MPSEPRKLPTLRLVGPPRAERGERRSPDAGRRGQQVRWTKVRAARARVAAGYYDRDAVRARVLDAVLEDLRRR